MGLNLDGSIPENNPHADKSAWSDGHRHMPDKEKLRL
jgi:hypothetical protein